MKPSVEMRREGLLILDIIHYVLAAIMVVVAGAWFVLLAGMAHHIRMTPRLKMCSDNAETPLVSVILPARNEEAYIGKCLQTLSNQDYPEYEIIAINDSSEDSTSDIIRRSAAADPRIKLVEARPKPDGWMGKNWACMEGYAQAKGQLLLFTDADTTFAPGVISAAVHHLLSERLDALTAIPQIKANDFLIRVTLPVISTFLHTRFSATRVNDPTKKTGYFFGSFFVMRHETYEAVGTHRSVRHEIIEDGALGRKVKESGYRLCMVLADEYIDAIWARDGRTLWNGLKRLMIPLYLQGPYAAIGILAAVAFLLFLPFPLAAYSATSGLGTSSMILAISSSAASLLALCGAAVETRILRIRLPYCLACPLGGAVITAGFLAGILGARKSNSVSWRGRRYTLRDFSHKFIDI